MKNVIMLCNSVRAVCEGVLFTSWVNKKGLVALHMMDPLDECAVPGKTEFASLVKLMKKVLAVHSRGGGFVDSAPSGVQRCARGRQAD